MLNTFSEIISIKKKVFTMKSKLLLTFALLIIALTGCDYFENGDTMDISTVEVNLQGLPVLPDSMTYVGWFGREKNGVNYYVKVFVQNANASGSINYKSEKPLKDLQEAQAFLLTTERVAVAQDSLLKPSSRVLLSGRYSEASAVLYIGASNLPVNFSNAKSVFTLDTPTDGPLTNETNGVWFVDSVSTTPVAGLHLPTLLGGWIYEGWVQVNGQYLSTGRFTDPQKADLFNGYSGILPGYNFPGEDFLLNAPSGFTFPLNLANAKVCVSIEYKDGRTHGTSPFLKVYEGTIPGSPQSRVSYNLQSLNPVLPDGNTFMVVDLVK